MPVVRVLTINIWGRAGDWAARSALLRKSIAELEPDVIAFQESFVLPGYDQITELVDGMRIVHQQARAPDGGGISTATRMPITAVHEVDLHVSAKPREFAAGALMVEVQAAQPVLFVNHFPSWRPDQENEREQQAVMVARKINEVISGRTVDVVIAGDMDADPSASSIRFWTGRTSLSELSVCYRDAWEATHPEERGETYTTANALRSSSGWPCARIDYILVSCAVDGGPALRIKSCERWLDAPVDGVWASDHFGVVAELEFRSAPAVSVNCRGF